MNFFEELEIGERLELGDWTFTSQEIIAFAEKYDPQRFHLSDEAARETHFGALCASGWHTAAIWMKLMVAYVERETAAVASGASAARLGPSPGFDNLKWLKPVFAGDTISYSSTLTGKRLSKSRPGWGLLTHLNEGTNQNGTKVFSFEGRVFIECAPS